MSSPKSRPFPSTITVDSEAEFIALRKQLNMHGYLSAKNFPQTRDFLRAVYEDTIGSVEVVYDGLRYEFYDREGYEDFLLTKPIKRSLPSFSNARTLPSLSGGFISRFRIVPALKTFGAVVLVGYLLYYFLQ